jgi:hypothetical protein
MRSRKSGHTTHALKTSWKLLLLAVCLLTAVSILRYLVVPRHKDSAQEEKKSFGVEGSTRLLDAHSPESPAADFDAMLKAASVEVDLAKRQKVAREWADAVARGAIAEMLDRLEWVSDLDLQSAFRLALLSRWAEEDLSGALSWFGQQTAPDGLNQELRDLLVRALGRHDPASSLSCMEETVPESLRHDIYVPFFRQWAHRDPASAAFMLLQLTDPVQGQSNVSLLSHVLLGLVAAQWANADLTSALAWARALPEGASKSEAMAQISYHWAKGDPQSAAAYAASQNDARMLRNVAGAWAERDPHAAAEWAGQLPNGLSEIALAGLIPVWTQHDSITP